MAKKPALSLEWLLDITQPLIIEGKGWRKKVKALATLPRWYYTPHPTVAEFFDSIRRGEKPKPNEELQGLVKEHLKRDLIAYMWHFVLIEDRDTRKRVMPTWTPGQVAIMWRAMECVHRGVPVRLALLKQRQGGFSQFISAICYWVVGFHPNVVGLQLAQDKDTTRRLHTYLKKKWTLLPKWLRPSRRHSTRYELTLEKPDAELLRDDDDEDDTDFGLESSIQAQTAGKDFPGTGEPIQVFHCSEVGKWHKVCDPEVVYTSAANAIQDEGANLEQDIIGTWIFHESTAHGSETYWHIEWKAALRIGQEGWNGFTPIFLPWYLDPRNVRKSVPGTEWGTDDKHEYGNEELLRELYDLSDEQLEWRRRTIQKQTGTPKRKLELFKQEHPSTQAEAWLNAHGNFIDTETMNKMRLRATERDTRRVIFQGDVFPNREKGNDLHFTGWTSRRALGPFTMWRPPMPKYEYLISADPAEGLGDGDFSCAKVWVRFADMLELVAEWYGQAPVDVFSQVLWRLGWFYSTPYKGSRMPALLAWERTGPGSGIGAWLRKGNVLNPNDAYPFNRMYRATRLNAVKHGRDSVFGISTNGSTKRPMLDMWLEWAAAGKLDMIGADVDEAGTLQIDDKDRVDTNSRDRVMAQVVGVYAHRTSQLHILSEAAPAPEPEQGTAAWADKIMKDGQAMREGRQAAFDVMQGW